MAIESLLDKELLIPLAGMLVGVVAILFPLGIVWLVLHFRHRKTEQLYATVQHLADKGQPIPPELLEPQRDDSTRGGDSALLRAMTLVGAGIGLGLMFWFMNKNFLIGIGVLVACIGVAQLIALQVERRKPAA